MNSTHTALCQGLHEHSSEAHQLSALAATVIEEQARRIAQLEQQLATGDVSGAPKEGAILKPRAKGWHQCPRCDRLHAQLSADSPLVQAHQAAVTKAQAALFRNQVEWTWKDTLEFVRQEFLSRDNYEKLVEGGTLVFNKRQLTNLLNAAFEYCQVTPLHPDTVKANAQWTSQAEPAEAPAAKKPDLEDPTNVALLAWWVGKRPFGWSEAEHLDDPTVYCTGAEKPLAVIAVELAKAKRA